MKVTEHFSYHGIELSVRSSHPDLVKAGAYVATCTGGEVQGGETHPDSGGETHPDSLCLELTYSEELPVIPDSASPYAEMAHGVSLWTSSTRLYVKHSVGIVELDAEAGTGIGVIRSDDNAYRHVLLLLTLSLAILLRRRGLYALHAAAAMDPNRGGYLFVGPSDSGKSTLAYSLVRAGWNFLSDDSVLVSTNSGSIVAKPFRRDFCMDATAAALFPELKGEWEPTQFDPEKRRVDMTTIFEGRRAQECTPQALVFPVIVDAEESRLTPMAKKEALLRILPQGGFLIDPDPKTASAQLKVLRILVDQTKSYRLESGRDLVQDSSLIAQMLP